MTTQSTARLQRWLDRLTAACGSKKWKSAVAEADCLSAELKQMREELWLQAEGEVKQPLTLRIKSGLAFGGKSFGIAMIIICMCTIPIAVESGVPNRQTASAPTVSAPNYEELTFVTAEEKELLQMLRKNLNESNMAVRAADKKSPMYKSSFTAQAVAGKQTAKPVFKEPALPVKSAETKKPIKAEDLLTLIQIGEKSLRGNDSAIKIIN
ncbi:MAG: hypothetical protein RRY12_02100 [Cloacibacillus sp.]